MNSDINKRKTLLLDKVFTSSMIEKDHWLTKKSAILIFHGVGNQRPFETLDTFARGMLETFTEAGFNNDSFTLTHRLVKRDDGYGGDWFDNYDAPFFQDQYTESSYSTSLRYLS